MNDSIDSPDRRRLDIAHLEREVERQHSALRVRTAETRERLVAWKVPLIVGGGALLGLLLGRVGASRRPARDAVHPPYSGRTVQPTDDHHRGHPAAATARAAGKAAGWMAALSLASRALPTLLPLLRAYADRDRPLRR